MKYLIICILLLVNTLGFAQEGSILLKKFVKQDTVQLRWAPASAAGLIKGLQKGYELERTNLLTMERDLIVVASLESRTNKQVDRSDTLTVFYAAYLKEMMRTSQEETMQTKSNFFLISLTSSINRRVAMLAGLYIEDIALASGKYRYQIRFIGDTEWQDDVEVNTTLLDKNPKCSELEGASRVDLKEIYLSWEAASLNDSYGGYTILKSRENRPFEVLNETPLFYFVSQYEPDKRTIDYIDTAVNEGETYHYKIQPVNHFADIGTESNTVSVYVQKRLNGSCRIDTITRNGLKRTILGEYITEFERDEISEFALQRADKIDGEYEFIVKQTAIDRNFEFEYVAEIPTGDRHYFRVAALSVDGDTAFSYPYYYFTLDQEPPGIPLEFAGEIDSMGVATLSWKAPVDKDIQGYRLFRANSLQEEFIEITNYLVEAHQFTDTLSLNNLTSEVYYWVRTVDLNYNNSPLSPHIALLKPDTIAPVPAVFLSYAVETAGIRLTWVNSDSEDLLNSAIHRSSRQGDTLIYFADSLTAWIDESCEIDELYTYRLQCEDRSHNKAFSAPLSVTYALGYRDAPVLKQPQINRQGKSILLQLPAPSEDMYAVQIYRKKNEFPFQLIATKRDDISEFVDEQLNINNTYQYKIKYIYASGKSSKMSNVVEVVY
jgi:hypothetical protein